MRPRKPCGIDTDFQVTCRVHIGRLRHVTAIAVRSSGQTPESHDGIELSSKENYGFTRTVPNAEYVFYFLQRNQIAPKSSPPHVKIIFVVVGGKHHSLLRQSLNAAFL